MRWILENINLIIVIAGAVAWWLNQRAREKAGQEADYDDDGTPEAPEQRGFEDPQLAERTRRIREEIQRRIEERRRTGDGYTTPARPTEPPPVPAPAELRVPTAAEAEEPPPLIREVIVAAAPVAPAAGVAEARRRAEILEQQASLAEQLRELETMKAAAARRAAYEATVAQHKAPVPAARVALLDDLKDASGLRRAVVLREVLGPPVGLR